MTGLAKPVVVGHTYYISVSMAAAKEGITEKTVRKNIQTKSDWAYFHQLTPSEKTRISNLTDQLRQSQKTAFQPGRPVQVGDVVFPSLNAAAKAASIHPRSARKRIESIHFSDWKWFDETE